MSKIVVLGLEGFSSDLVREWSGELPNLVKIQRDGVWGDIRSTVPPTSAQTWTSVRCGRNPGSFGYWDAAYRDDFSYGEPKRADSEAADRVNLLQKMLPKMGQKVARINVPVSWPPKKIPAGFCITGSDTPDLQSGFTYPDSLADEVKGLVGEYIIRVSDAVACLGMDEDKALKRIYDMDTQRFTLLKHFLREKRCDHIMAVVDGPELMAHSFYHFMDETHKRYDPDPKYKNALLDYYKSIDKNVGEVREALPNNTVLLVLSAYGSQKLDGRINLNEWLIQEGYMTLLDYPKELTALGELKVDWSKTKAWSTGSTTGQIYLNVKAREAQGIVEPDNSDKLLDELTAKLKNIPDENGKKLNTQIYKRDDIQFGPYVKYGPDMFIYFDECRLATSELVGYGRGEIYSVDTPLGPDYAAHCPYGYFCMSGPRIAAKGQITGISLLNIAPTVLDVSGLQIPREMERPSILAMLKEEKAAPPPKMEQKVRSRLEALGY